MKNSMIKIKFTRFLSDCNKEIASRNRKGNSSPQSRGSLGREEPLRFFWYGNL